MDPCQCAEHAETFWSLITSGPHWALELTIEAATGLFGVAIWPLVRRVWKNTFHKHTECCTTKE